jgi:hypothetical protein
VAEGVEPYSIRDDIAEVLRDLFPLYEAGKFGNNVAPYGRLVDELGLARVAVLGEWRQAVADALPVFEPVDDAVERGKRDILSRAVKYIADQKHVADLLANEYREDKEKTAWYRGQYEALTGIQAYLEGAAGELC